MSCLPPSLGVDVFLRDGVLFGECHGVIQSQLGPHRTTRRAAAVSGGRDVGDGGTTGIGGETARAIVHVRHRHIGGGRIARVEDGIGVFDDIAGIGLPRNAAVGDEDVCLCQAENGHCKVVGEHTGDIGAVHDARRSDDNGGTRCRGDGRGISGHCCIAVPIWHAAAEPCGREALGERDGCPGGGHQMGCWRGRCCTVGCRGADATRCRRQIRRVPCVKGPPKPPVVIFCARTTGVCCW